MVDVKPEDAARVQVVSAENKVTLNTKNGTVWTVAEQQDFPVDKKKVVGLFVKLTTVKLAHEVTRNPDKLSDLGLLTLEENGGKAEKDKTATSVTVFDRSEKPVFELLIGKDRRGQGGMSFGGTYVRFPGEQVAYLVSDGLLTDHRPQDWIDPVVINVDADKFIESVHVQRPGKKPIALSHSKAGEPWTVTGLPQEQVDQASVRRVINQLGGLDAFKVAPANSDPKDVGRTSMGRVAFRFFDNRRFTMDVGETKAPDNFRYLSIHAEMDSSAQDEELQKWVEDFNDKFSGRLLAIYDWDGGRILQELDEYRKKEEQKK